MESLFQDMPLLWALCNSRTAETMIPNAWKYNPQATSALCFGPTPEGWPVPGSSNVKMGPAALSPPQPTVPEAFREPDARWAGRPHCPQFCLQFCNIGDACSIARACSKKVAPSQPLKMPATLPGKRKTWYELMMHLRRRSGVII